MSPLRLKEIMQLIGFGSIDVAVLTGVTQRTVQMWLAETSPIPLAPALVLEGFAEGRLPMEWVEDKIIEMMKSS